MLLALRTADSIVHYLKTYIFILKSILNAGFLASVHNSQNFVAEMIPFIIV